MLLAIETEAAKGKTDLMGSKAVRISVHRDSQTGETPHSI
jgi:hypothetical protein